MLSIHPLTIRTVLLELFKKKKPVVNRIAFRDGRVDTKAIIMELLFELIVMKHAVR